MKGHLRLHSFWCVCTKTSCGLEFECQKVCQCECECISWLVAKQHVRTSRHTTQSNPVVFHAWKAPYVCVVVVVLSNSTNEWIFHFEVEPWDLPQNGGKSGHGLRKQNSEERSDEPKTEDEGRSPSRIAPRSKKSRSSSLQRRRR